MAPPNVHHDAVSPETIVAENLKSSPSSSSLLSWATVDPDKLGVVAEPYAVSNIVDGQWQGAATTMDIPHPLDKDAPPIFSIPDTQVDELQPFIDSLRSVPKSGVHNPFKNPERYVQYGEITRKASDGRECSNGVSLLSHI